MFHCGGGPGANTFNTLKPLEEWVEQGAEPDGITASHVAAGGLGAPVNPVVGPTNRQMPLCAWPEMARHIGQGSVFDGSQWICDPHDRRMLEVGLNGRQAGLPAPDLPSP
jgi:feruloyl esterase